MIDMDKSVKIYDYERLDDLHRNGYMIIQDPKRFCFGIDAVLLSDFAQASKKEIVLDLGTGTGVIPILMEAKNEAEKYYALEIQHESAEMAARSVKLNNLDDKIKIIEGDIKELTALFKPSYFDVITVNPPYMNHNGGLKNNFSPKAIARHEILCSLDDILIGSSKLLKSGGRFYMIHRPNRLAEIIFKLKEHKMEPKKMRFVHPYIYKEPTMVLIEAVRSGKPMTRVMPPLIIYNENGEYTKEIYDIYYN